MSGRNFKKPKRQCKACNCFVSNNNYNKHVRICAGKPSLYVRHANGAAVKQLKLISDLNWSEIQSFYDNNHSYKDVCKQYNLSTSTVARAIKKGLFKTRSRTETARLRGSYNNKVVSEETRAKLSQSMRRAVLEGRQKTPRPYGEKCNHYDHVSWLGNKEHLHGGWEKIVAEFFDEQKIRWCKSKKSFTYTWQDKEHEYFPDFYLDEYDTYIEVKGCKVERDEAKWSDFPEKLLVVDKNSIYNLKQYFKDNLTMNIFNPPTVSRSEFRKALNLRCHKDLGVGLNDLPDIIDMEDVYWEDMTEKEAVKMIDGCIEDFKADAGIDF